jgi:SOS-response transcriptional repressor LexA
MPDLLDKPGQRLAYAVAEYDGTQQEFADLLGWSTSMLRDRIRGDVKIKREEAAMLTERGLVNGHWLLTGEGPHGVPLRHGIAEEGRSYQVVSPTDLPVVGTVAADDVQVWTSTGEERDETDGPPQHIASVPDRHVAVRVAGASLEPVARAGQLLILDVAHRTPREGDLVVILTTDGRVLAKRYFRDDDECVLVAVNPVAAIPPIRLPDDELDTLRVVIGVLFE